METHVDRLAAAASACAEVFTRFGGSRTVSAGSVVRRYGVVTLATNTGEQCTCLTVREPGFRRRRVFMPSDVVFTGWLQQWRLVSADDENLHDFQRDLPEIARRLLPIMRQMPDGTRYERIIGRALRVPMPVYEGGLEVPDMAGLSFLSEALIPHQEGYHSWGGDLVGHGYGSRRRQRAQARL